MQDTDPRQHGVTASPSSPSNTNPPHENDTDDDESTDTEEGERRSEEDNKIFDEDERRAIGITSRVTYGASSESDNDADADYDDESEAPRRAQYLKPQRGEEEEEEIEREGEEERQTRSSSDYSSSDEDEDEWATFSIHLNQMGNYDRGTNDLLAQFQGLLISMWLLTRGLEFPSGSPFAGQADETGCRLEEIQKKIIERNTSMYG
jgi:hypothetical protein